MHEVIIDGILYVPKHSEQYLSFWYMHANHTFTRLKGNTLKELRDHGYNIGNTSPGGMLCKPNIITTVRNATSGENRKVEKSFGVHAHSPSLNPSNRKKVWLDAVNAWQKAIEAHPLAVELLQAGKILL